jgi:glycosyltransferase involved in cell wall biosynthesis
VRRARAWNLIEEHSGFPYPLLGPEFLRLARNRIAWADVVHAHGFLFQPSVVALAMARWRASRAGGPARVLTEHGARGSYPSWALRALESTAIHSLGAVSLRSAQAVIAINSRIAAQVGEFSPRTRVVELPNGIDMSGYRPASAEERSVLRAGFGWDQQPRVLFVGRLVPRKGADLAAQAISRLGSEARLVMAGPGNPGQLPENAEALGELPPEQVAQLYRAADCFLLPSVAEGFPLSAQQALASGLPVVLSDDPVYEPYLEGAPAGVLRVPRTVDSIVDALREIDCGLRIGAEERANLAEFARTRYSLTRWAERHEALYAELIEG